MIGELVSAIAGAKVRILFQLFNDFVVSPLVVFTGNIIAQLIVPRSYRDSKIVHSVLGIGLWITVGYLIFWIVRT